MMTWKGIGQAIQLVELQTVGTSNVTNKANPYHVCKAKTRDGTMKNVTEGRSSYWTLYTEQFIPGEIL